MDYKIISVTNLDRVRPLIVLYKKVKKPSSKIKESHKIGAGGLVF